MKPTTLFTMAGSLALLCACGSEASRAAGGTGGQGGEGASQGVGGEGAGGSAADPDLADHRALAMCADDSACPTATAQRIEGGDPMAMNGVACVVTAMRDRTPGRYHLELDHSHSQGSDVRELTIVITPSGSIEVGIVATSSDQLSGDTVSDHLPTERCDPKPVAFFDACLTELQLGEGMDASDAAWTCVFPAIGQDPDWLDNCVTQSPTCQ